MTSRWLVSKLERWLLSDHFIQCFFNLFPLFYRNFTPGMLYWGKGRVCPDGKGPRHVTYSVKRVRKGSFQCYNVPDLGYSVRGSCWGWLHLKVAENWLWGHGEGGICQSGVPNGLGRGGNWWQNVLIGPVMVKTAYLDFFLAVHGLGKAVSQWIFTLEGSSLPLAMVAGWGHWCLFWTLLFQWLGPRRSHI